MKFAVRNLLKLSLMLVIVLIGCDEENPIDIKRKKIDEGEKRVGGDLTVDFANSGAFGQPAPNLVGENLVRHLDGDVDFEQLFVKAPALVNSGLGPIFNNSSCENCHVGDGRGLPPEDGTTLESFFLRISLPGKDEFGGPNPLPGFGTQLQNKSLFNFEPEGTVQITYVEVSGKYPDGEKYSLRKPHYTITGRVPQDNLLISPRVAPVVFGVGLLEAIKEEDVLALSDEFDTNKDGISGKPNYVWDFSKGKTIFGRFGWKANNPTVLQQNAGAYKEDMGVTNPYFSMESCHGNPLCDTLSDDPEVTQEILDDVTFYVQTLGIPARRDFEDFDVIKGGELFTKVGCNSCHNPEFTTGTHDISELSNQRIFPYTDLLLHDMGEGLADHRPDFLATGFEWRTPPLWGIGLINLVNGHTFLLHDGRARGVEEAILWHGGEAEKVRDNFKYLTKKERKQLLKFVNSL